MTVKPIKNIPTVVSVDQSTLRALEDDNHNMKQIVDLLELKVELFEKRINAQYGLVKSTAELVQKLAQAELSKGAGHDGE